jgi:hypothetical protein
LVAIDPNGRISEFGHDPFGRLRRVLTPTSDGNIEYFSAVPEVTYPDLTRWGVFGVRATFLGRGVSEQYFDAFGRLVGQSATGFDAETGSATSVVSEYAYDWAGRITQGTCYVSRPMARAKRSRFASDGPGGPGRGPGARLRAPGGIGATTQAWAA